MIPAKDGVTALISELLTGLPTRAKGYTLSVSDEATDTEVTAIFDCLLTAEKHMTVTTRFYLGDAYNQVTKRRRAKNEALAPIYKKFGEKYKQLLRTYGWVAGKWPEADRIKCADKPWSHFLRKYPDGIKAPKTRGATNLTFVSSEDTDEGQIWVGRSKKGHEYRFLIVPAEDEADEQDAIPTGEPFMYRQRQGGYGAEVLREEAEED